MSRPYHLSKTEQDALKRALFRSVKVLSYPPEYARCPHCRGTDAAWKPEDLAAGKRWQGATLVYHCYAGYCWD